MKKTLPTLLLATSFALLQTAVWAEKDNAMLDALSDEAKSTSMEEDEATPDDVPEPAVVPSSSSTDLDTLEKRVAAQIKGVLSGESAKQSDGEPKSEEAKAKQLADQLEQVVAGSLMEGNKLKDIRSAVSAAMADISKTAAPEEGGSETAEGTISKQTVESAAKALQSIVGENKEIAAGDRQDAYIQSLKSELADDSVVPDKVETSAQQSASPKEAEIIESRPVTDVTSSEPAATTEPVSAAQTITEPEPVAEATTTAAANTVTVLQGETLFKIAQRVYGSGAKYLDLYEANKDVIENPDLIRVGQVLKIP